MAGGRAAGEPDLRRLREARPSCSRSSVDRSSSCRCAVDDEALGRQRRGRLDHPRPGRACRACGAAPRGRRASRARRRPAGRSSEAYWTGSPSASRYMVRLAAAGPISRKSSAARLAPHADDGEAAAARGCRPRGRPPPAPAPSPPRRPPRCRRRAATASPASVAWASPDATAPPVPAAAEGEAAKAGGGANAERTARSATIGAVARLNKLLRIGLLVVGRRSSSSGGLARSLVRISHQGSSRGVKGACGCKELDRARRRRRRQI